VSLDALSALAQIGTFIVIAATAVAALVQLNHMRSANQVTAINMFAQAYEGPEMRDAFDFVRTRLKTKLEDPEFRQQLRESRIDRATHPEMIVANFFDQWGGYYRQGVIDRAMFMRYNAGIVTGFWSYLEPAIAILASRTGTNTSFEQFEYLTVQARAWKAEHPEGDYPKGVDRIPLVDPWRDIDKPRDQPRA